MSIFLPIKITFENDVSNRENVIMITNKKGNNYFLERQLFIK